MFTRWRACSQASGSRASSGPSKRARSIGASRKRYARSWNGLRRHGCAPNAVEHPPPDTIDPKTQLFYWSLQFRHDVVPYAFADLGVYHSRQDDLTRWFRTTFRHPILEFTDGHWVGTGSSPWFYVMQYIVHEYLRRVLLGSDLTIELPYRASGDELRSFAESAGDTLVEIGVGRPRLDLRPGSAHVGGSRQFISAPDGP
jgi:hypothetical protein